MTRPILPLPRLPSARTLSRLALRGAGGREWYRYARSEVSAAAGTLGIDPGRLADLLALFSPRVSVKRSVRHALTYAASGTFAHDCTRHIRSAVAHYERTGEIRGPKTSAFARVLRGDDAAVVLDIWMSRAFRIDQKLFERPVAHRECVRRVRKAARMLGWTPAETQAAIWTAVATLGPGEMRAAGDKRYRTAPALSIVSEISLFDERKAA